MRNILVIKKLLILIIPIVFFIGCGDSGKKISKPTMTVAPSSTPTSTPIVTQTPTLYSSSNTNSK